MAKVIVERPRMGGGYKYPRAAASWRGNHHAVENLARREGIRRPWSGRRKGLNENLAPLRRYLRSQVGRPWDKVFAEVCRHMNRNSAVQLHIWQHLQMEVCTDPHVIAGAVRRFGGAGFSGHLGRFYVDLRTGLLRQNKAYDRWRKTSREREPARKVIRVDSSREYRLIDGTWWELKLAPLGRDQYWADDVVFKKVAWPAPREDLQRLYGRPVYAVARRQLDKEEVSRLGRLIWWP